MKPIAAIALLALTTSCPGPRAQPVPKKPAAPGTQEPSPPAAATEPPPPAEAKISVHSVRSKADIEALPKLGKGVYRIHLIDVGTGLSVFVEGLGWNLLYDGGSGDDQRGVGKKANDSRLVAYLWAVTGPSGPRKCKPEGDAWTYDVEDEDTMTVVFKHVFLSHPHDDHGSLLDDVLTCYDADHVWDVGLINPTGWYADWWEQIAAESFAGGGIHTVAPLPSPRVLKIKKKQVQLYENIPWSEITDGQEVKLDDSAKFTILHANAKKQSDYNANSLVLRLDLGRTSVLLTGDAESGPRKPPDSPVGDVEKHLLDKYRALIDVDILQVGHHGSLSANRLAFLEAVSPKYALLSAGPKSYRGVVLPDAEVIDALKSIEAEILRTDEHDKIGCPVADKIGNNDKRPGGCDSWVLVIASGE